MSPPTATFWICISAALGVAVSAFQARDRWGHPGATSGPRTTGAQRTRTVTVGLSSAQLTDQAEADVAGRRDAPRLPRTEEVKDGARPNRWSWALMLTVHRRQRRQQIGSNRRPEGPEHPPKDLEGPGPKMCPGAAADLRMFRGSSASVPALDGDAERPGSHGKDGVAGSIPAGGSTRR
jgi:hypothetical protein